MAKWIIAAILLLPLAEIAAFILVAALVGLGSAFVLMLATTLAGFLVLRRAGRSIARFRVAMANTDVAGVQANAAGLVTVLAGLLLFLPGFLTDLVGVALLISPIRRWFGRTFRQWVVRRRNPADRSTIDLAPEDWQQLPERELPHKPDRRD